jgi:hypothetical protein
VNNQFSFLLYGLIKLFFVLMKKFKWYFVVIILLGLLHSISGPYGAIYNVISGVVIFAGAVFVISVVFYVVCLAFDQEGRSVYSSARDSNDVSQINQYVVTKIPMGRKNK